MLVYFIPHVKWHAIRLNPFQNVISAIAGYTKLFILSSNFTDSFTFTAREMPWLVFTQLYFLVHYEYHVGTFVLNFFYPPYPSFKFLAMQLYPLTHPHKKCSWLPAYLYVMGCSDCILKWQNNLQTFHQILTHCRYPWFVCQLMTEIGNDVLVLENKRS